MIPKGTRVLIRTTNGGEREDVLVADHHLTYDACFDGYIVVGYRIKEIKPVLTKKNG
jgi:hypothetical protein